MSLPIQEVNKTSKSYIMSKCFISYPSHLKQVASGFNYTTMILK